MKSEHKQFAVIGLGRFGLAICQELQEAGAQVLALDVDEERVRCAANIVNHAIVANCANEETVAELKLDEYDMVMVAIGSDVNASILTTLVVKEAGTKAVWVKANDRFHSKILQKIGADSVIMPERDMGVRVARKMLDKRVFDYHSLGSGMAMTEIVIGSKFMGKSLDELPFLKEPNVQILGLKRGPEIDNCPDFSRTLEMGDMLIVTGPQAAIEKKIRSL